VQSPGIEDFVVPGEAHPSAEELAAFALGKRTTIDAASIEEHLLNCDACVRILERQPVDALLRLARWAESSSAESSDPDGNAPTGAEVRTSADDAAPHDYLAATVDGFPAELREHSRYRIVRLLGRGGMGIVYEAEHLVMGRPVAIKVIHRAYTASSTAVERFRREVRAAARLQHPNIVTAHDADQAGDVHFLVMERVDGVGLGELLQMRGPLPVAEACDYVRQAALGLQHAHERGMVHRDVKPDNLMRADDGTVKLLDFGLAALTVDPVADGLTDVDILIGTPDYMAPEQAEDPRDADTRADVYGLGCTLFHLLTGHVPYPADTPLKKILAHREKPLPIGDLGADVPPGLTAVLVRMLAKKPDDRFQTPGEVARALEPFTKSTSAPAMPARPKKPRRLLVGVLLLLLIAAAATAWFVLHRRGDAEQTIPTNDPEVALVVKGRQVVRLIDPQTRQMWNLESKHYWLGMAEQPAGLTIELADREPLVIHCASDGKLTVVRKKQSLLAIAWSARTCKVPAEQCLPKAIAALGREHNFIVAEIRGNAAFGWDERYAVVVLPVVAEDGVDIHVEAFGPDKDDATRLSDSVLEHVCHGPYDPAVPARIVNDEGRRQTHAPVLRLAGESRNEPVRQVSDSARNALLRQGLTVRVHDDLTRITGHEGNRGAVVAYEEPQGDIKGYVSIVTAAPSAAEAERMLSEIQADVLAGKRSGQ
jgi:tRNA A-37 threonylcarbamoyl transferase component Bud32